MWLFEPSVQQTWSNLCTVSTRVEYIVKWYSRNPVKSGIGPSLVANPDPQGTLWTRHHTRGWFRHLRGPPKDVPTNGFSALEHQLGLSVEGYCPYRILCDVFSQQQAHKIEEGPKEGRFGHGFNEIF